MRFIRGILRLFAIIFNLAAGFFLIGIGFLGSLTGEDIHFPLVPSVEGEALKWTLMGLGLFAIGSTLLALTRSTFLRFLMVLWNLLVVGLLVCAATRSSYRFEGEEHFRQGLILFGASLLALWGAWAQMKAARRPAAVV
jgi:hypothetical protein